MFRKEPKLTDLFTSDNPILNGTANTIATFLFIAVVGSAIEETVASLDSVVYSLD